MAGIAVAAAAVQMTYNMCTLVGRDGKHKRERRGSVYAKEMHATSSDLCKYMYTYMALTYLLFGRPVHYASLKSGILQLLRSHGGCM